VATQADTLLALAEAGLGIAIVPSVIRVNCPLWRTP